MRVVSDTLALMKSRKDVFGKTVWGSGFARDDPE